MIGYAIKEKATISQLAAAAIADGRHSQEFQTVCGGCRAWTDGIYHVTEAGVRLCRTCAIACGGFKPLEFRREIHG